MIADLSGALAAVYRPPWRQERQRLVSRTLEIDECAVREPACRQLRADRLEQIRCERRIEEDDIEASGWTSEKLGRLCNVHDAATRTKPTERLVEMPADCRLAIDEVNFRRSARQSFETERSAAREQIEAARTDDGLL